jgi:hypothetical protein
LAPLINRGEHCWSALSEGRGLGCKIVGVSRVLLGFGLHLKAVGSHYGFKQTSLAVC